MRTLSLSQSERCENAEGKKCRCRCAGAAHGQKRGSVWDLPLSDPHTLKKLCPICGGKGFIRGAITKFTCLKCDGLGYREPRRKIFLSEN